MTTPAQTYIDWFKSLAVHQRTDVAFLVGAHIPGGPIDTSMDAASIEAKFVAWIQDISTYGTLSHAAAIVSLIAVTELMIIRKRDKTEDWKNTKAMLTTLAQTNETFAKSAEEADFRGRQWVAACNNWKTTRKDALSDSFIENWIEKNSRFATRV